MESLEFIRVRRCLSLDIPDLRSWLCVMLQMAGANVVGYALKPAETEVISVIGHKGRMNSIEGDIRISTI